MRAAYLFLALLHLPGIARASNPPPFWAEVGEAQEVLGPVADAVFASPLVAINSSGRIRAYTADGQSFLLIDGPTLQDVLPSAQDVGLSSSPNATDLDACGAWLTSAFVDGDTVHAYYAQEWQCDVQNNFYTNKSIAYAQSKDGGKTFQKVGHPNNAIILPPYGNTSLGHQTGEGDHSVTVASDGYLYLYFRQWNGQYSNLGVPSIGVARAPVSTAGLPGNWTKFYQNEWSEPGLHGKSTELPNIPGTKVYYRSKQNDFISVDTKSPSLLNLGLYCSPTLGFSSDGISWVTMPAPLIPLPDDVSTHCGLNHSDISLWRELVNYPALTGLGGNTDVSDAFWFYYTYREPGPDVADLYLARRWVTLRPAPQGFTGPWVLLELTQWFNPSKQDHWATTAMVASQSGYSGPVRVGQVLTEQRPGTLPIYDCFLYKTYDHMVGTSEADCQGSRIDPGTLLRKLGWIYQSQQPGTVPLYRCHDASNNHHSVSVNGLCPTGDVEDPLGYIVYTAAAQ